MHLGVKCVKEAKVETLKSEFETSVLTYRHKACGTSSSMVTLRSVTIG